MCGMLWNSFNTDSYIHFFNSSSWAMDDTIQEEKAPRGIPYNMKPKIVQWKYFIFHVHFYTLYNATKTGLLQYSLSPVETKG